MITLYLCIAFTEIPYLSTARNLWIETAMTTGDHQWLATYLFPKSVIDKVMDAKIEDNGQVGITEIKNEFDNEIINEDEQEFVYDESFGGLIPDSESFSTIKYNSIFSDDDEFGNKVIVNDREQGIKIVEVKETSYTGKLVFIDDPSRVFIAETDNKGNKGKLILDYLEDEDAIIGINANGFLDYNGVGLGGDIIGYSVSNGEVWGSGNINTYTTIGFTKNNELIVGKINNFNDYEIRDAAQFKPALIIDGEILTTGTAGWGLQPRTIVAQREDGVVIFLVVDGRQPGYSVGITMGEAAELLYSYGAINAAACDGGSSSVLAYNGEIINSPSTPMTTGRYLPNAFLVKRK